MAVSIRLARRGRRHEPHYFIVAQDKQKSPKGSFLEKLGYYNPSTNPITLELDITRAEHWLSEGAQISVTVKKLLQIAKDGVEPKKPKTKKFGKKKEEGYAAESAEAVQESEKVSETKEPAADNDADAPAEDA